MARAERGPAGLQVTITSLPRRSVSNAGLASWLKRAAPRRASGSVSIAIVSDAHVRALNRRYRKKDYATDVLSFPAAPVARLKPRAPGGTKRRSAEGRIEREASAERLLGDIVIARGVAARQARQAGHGTAVELRILALHGLLHLLGYDHERDNGRMRSTEQRLLRQAGVRYGLIDRTVR